jgi:hypothetical protein
VLGANLGTKPHFKPAVSLGQSMDEIDKMNEKSN